MDAPTLNVDARSAVQAGDGALFGRGTASTGASDFGSVLGKMQQAGDETPAAFARRTAENFVAIGLVQPLLKQMRESNHAAPPFAPTEAEKQFQGLADAELAQRMVRAARFPVVDKIAERLMDRYRAGAALRAETTGAGVEVAA
ncbi:MAG TPA: hypothetical protein PKE29_04785 [Phycisphaerales bacterium]|nr:hypothetical protein [Phycisphaerales bacterium]